MMIRRIFLTLSIACSSLALASPEEDQALFEHGIRAYQAGDYTEAARCFGPLVEKGHAKA